MEMLDSHEVFQFSLKYSALLQMDETKDTPNGETEKLLSFHSKQKQFILIMLKILSHHSDSQQNN